MSDPTNINENQKQSKNPVDNALNRIKETASKELQNKVNDKVKAYHEAVKLVNTLKNDIKELMQEQAIQAKELSEIFAEFKTGK